MAEHADLDILTDRVKQIACNKCGTTFAVDHLEPFTKTPCPSCGAEQVVPVQFGGFFLVALLGKGGMGAVYRGFDATLGRYVALKVMRREFSEDEAQLEGFLREARATAALNHRNVVQIYSCGQEKGQPYIIMEMVGGSRLDELMGQGQPVDEARLLEIATDVAQGLRAAHEVGLVHGDIKPANILLDKKGIAKVVDFGLARFAASQQAPGEVWGTPYYIAPEKVRHRKEDHRSDCYSLGATLFHALSNTPPFDAPTAKDVVMARLKQDLPDIRDLRPDIHPETAYALQRMLKREPSERYPTYASLLADLEVAQRAVRAGPAPPREPQKKSRKGLIITLVSLLLVAGLGGFGVMKWNAIQEAKREAEANKPKVRYVMRGGKFVAVPMDELSPAEEAATGASAEEGSATGGDAKADGPVPVEGPAPLFEDEVGTTFASALADVGAGRTEEGRTKLKEIAHQLPDTDPAYHWVVWAESARALVAGEEAPRLEAMRNLSFEDPAEGPPHPGTMVQTLARFLSGDMDALKLSTLSSEWPKPYRDVALFATGAGALAAGKPGEAKTPLTEYLAQPPDETHAWAYAFSPVATRWTESLGAWETSAQSVEAKLEAGDVSGAAAALSAEGATLPPYLRKPFDALQERIDTKRAQAEGEAARQAEAAAKQVAIDADLAILDTVRSEVKPLVAKKAFDQAQKRFAAAERRLQTDEGREAHKSLAALYGMMSDLKVFLVRKIQTHPFGTAARRQTGGAVVGASREGLRVALGDAGETLRPWNKVGARLFVWMADRYLADPGIEVSTSAPLFAGLSFFCQEGGALEPARSYATKARVEGSGLSEGILKLLPETPAPPDPAKTQET